MLVTAPVLLGASSFVAENADMLSIRGPGEFNHVNGTLIHKHFENGQWYGLYSRNGGANHIELSVENGVYYVETWSIPANPASPQRVHSGMEITIDGGSDPNPPGGYGVTDLMALLAAWGPCKGNCPYDFNGDGSVGTVDLLHLLANWG